MPDWGIIAARLLQYGAAVILFGTPVFYLYGIAGGATEWRPRRWSWPHLIVLVAAISAFVGAVWWLLAETATIFSDPGTFTAGAIWTVASGTTFGRAVFARTILIAALIVMIASSLPGRRSWIWQSVLGAAIIITFAWTGHGGKDEGMAGAVHAAGDVVHLLAAGVWLGALLPLCILILLSIRSGTVNDARITCTALDKFSGVGPTVVAALVLTGVINSWFLIGPQHVGELFTTPYGQLLIVKIVLFAAMLCLATANRLAFCPKLGFSLELNHPAAGPLTALRRSVATETVVAVVVLFAVSWMGTLQPPGS